MALETLVVVTEETAVSVVAVQVVVDMEAVGVA